MTYATPRRAAHKLALGSMAGGARRDLVVFAFLSSAILMFIWNGSNLFGMMRLTNSEMTPTFKLAWTALVLNVALILFFWRRYIDIVHENERRIESEERARRMATTDPMTGLLNRKGFADQAEALLLQALDERNRVVILSLQLQRLKHVNDRHGYDIGDRAMRLLADALCESLPAEAVAARLGGDEFAIALPCHVIGLEESVEAVADRMVRSVTRPFGVEGKTIQVGAFVGIAVGEGDLPVPALLRRSDIALAQGRTACSARPVWFDDGMERALMARGEIEQGLRHALEHDLIVPYFEPQVDLQTGAITGFEVLARWLHPSNGVIGPDLFIPVAEECGLIGRVSDVVMRKAMLSAKDWDPALTIAINISPTQLADSWLAQRVVRLLDETGFAPERLVLEITEGSLFADLDLARTIVAALKRHGMKLALDDFGSGFSSLAHLRALPFDMIKIDRSFVLNVDGHRENAAIIRAVATLAQALDVPVTVEGIEHATTHAAVMALGCRLGQGWLFGKAMPADEAARLIATNAAQGLARVG